MKCTSERNIKAIFAARLREWRTTHRLPLKAVAQEMGVAVSSLSQWECGLVLPSASKIALISCYTSLPPCYFFCPEHCALAVTSFQGK